MLHFLETRSTKDSDPSNGENMHYQCLGFVENLTLVRKSVVEQNSKSSFYNHEILEENKLTPFKTQWFVNYNSMVFTDERPKSHTNEHNNS